MKLFKRIFKVSLSALVLLSILANLAFASEGNYSWYIKRNGNERPKIQKEQEIIYEYDGYFLDKKLSDSDTKRVIYLTFDLGYANESTYSILDTLRKEKIPAAFFILDNIILKNTEMVTKMVEDGHIICNHTKNHKNLCNAGDEEIAKNITDLEKLYQEKTGYTMAKYFRFPEGRYSENALRCIKNLGYKTIFWSFAYDDWDNNRQQSPDRAIKKVIDNTHNGAVLLFHPTSKTNADIFETLINKWREMGYTFGTLDELVE